VGWEPAQAGLNAKQRGQLLHAVLHSVWSGPPEGIRTHEELRSQTDLESLVRNHVRRTLSAEMPQSAREGMSRAYRELEEIRLIRLVTEWLEFERTRVEFSVYGTEVNRAVNVGGLNLDLRLDRIDRLNDGSLLVIDYKSGDVKTKAWELPRPDDVQLPLYAEFAIDRKTEQLGGLAFGKIRAGKVEFVGRVFEPDSTLFNRLGNKKAIVRDRLTQEHLDDWKNSIKQLAQDFLDGNADVDPREYPKTCERCDLHVLCRVQENRAESDDGDEEETDDE
jgi:ATP-dependent helicase/DNAse subunit B